MTTLAIWLEAGVSGPRAMALLVCALVVGWFVGYDNGRQNGHQ